LTSSSSFARASPLLRCCAGEGSSSSEGRLESMPADTTDHASWLAEQPSTRDAASSSPPHIAQPDVGATPAALPTPRAPPPTGGDDTPRRARNACERATSSAYAPSSSSSATESIPESEPHDTTPCQPPTGPPGTSPPIRSGAAPQQSPSVLRAGREAVGEASGPGESGSQGSRSSSKALAVRPLEGVRRSTFCHDDHRERSELMEGACQQECIIWL